MGADLNTVLYKILRYANKCLEEGVEPDLGIMREVADTNELMFSTALEQASKLGLLEGVVVRNYVSGNGKPVVFSRHMHITVDGTTYLEDNSKMREVAGIMSGVGSSPRMRGTPRQGGHHRPDRGIIPAYAGNTALSSGSRSLTRDHPRVCGEHVVDVFEFCH